MTDVGLRVMDVSSARRLTERIRLNVVAVRDGVEKLQALLEEAKDGNVHVALGYPSWPAYIAEVMGDEPLRLSRDDRREIVHYLTGEGMSTRAIGSALGVSAMQVSRDRDRPAAGVTNVTPAYDQHERHEIDEMAPTNVAPQRHKTVDGLDGKTYMAQPIRRPGPHPARPPEPTPGPPAPLPAERAERRRPLPDAFFDAVYDLGKKAESVRRLIEDDRFPQNAEKVAAKHRNDLLRIRDLIDQVLAQLPTEGDSR